LLKLRGESRNQEAEAEFIVSLQKNLAFAQVILDREAELTSRYGGLEFDYNLFLNTEPPAYTLLPLHGPERRPSAQESMAPPPPERSPEPQAAPSQPQPGPPPQAQPYVRPERNPRPGRRDPTSRRPIPGREYGNE
jgi:hypothetical protein